MSAHASWSDIIFSHSFDQTTRRGPIVYLLELIYINDTRKNKSIVMLKYIAANNLSS